MGTAAQESCGEMRLSLSATAAAAALYGVVILFGVGPATPSALDLNDDLRTPVVHVPHGSAASGPALRLPQASPGPDRQRSRKARPVATGNLTAVPAALPERPEGAVPAPGQPKPAPAQPAASPASPTSSAPTQSVASLLEVTIPMPEVTVPPVTLPPVTLPSTPELPQLPPAPPLLLP